MTAGTCLVSLDKDLVDVLLGDGYGIAGVFDPDTEAVTECNLTAFGPDEAAMTVLAQRVDLRLILAIDPPGLRGKLSRHYGEGRFDSFLARDAYRSPRSELGHGTVVQRAVQIIANARVGRFCKINVGAQIHHDTIIGNYSTVAPAAVILGGVTIGEATYIGANATILPNLNIGADAMIGAGAVVTRNIPAGGRVAGVPARPLPPTTPRVPHE
ncbi:hypothetical protein LOC51_36110 [Rubrivivax sp. JA1024]|nr:hypothetical protein [Rubrivivax sp. JA1024]